MKRTVSLSFSEATASEAKDHLFSGDGLEAVALVLCSRRDGLERTRLLAQSVHPVPYAACTERTPETVAWPTEAITDVLTKAAEHGLSVVKIHSHPGGYRSFSAYDDASDRALFPSVHGWVYQDVPHASVVMLPDGSMFGRTVDQWGNFSLLRHINIAGDDLNFWITPSKTSDVPEHGQRIAQAFGQGTYDLLRHLKVGVVGASGTGNPMGILLARNCVGNLSVVDEDFIEHVNLNRLLSATGEDAANAVSKVEHLAAFIQSMGLGTHVDALHMNLATPEAVRAIADCDVLIGGVDTAFGRHLMNRISSYYLIPYFDIGIKLVADGAGGLNHACGSVHFVKPGGSSLLSRGVYTLDDIYAEELKRTDPDAYADQLDEGYLKGGQENRPAVGSINLQAVAMAANELLIRLHGLRIDDNSDFAVQRFELVNGINHHESHGEPCPVFNKLVARGDTPLLLDFPVLSEGEVAA